MRSRLKSAAAILMLGFVIDKSKVLDIRMKTQANELCSVNIQMVQRLPGVKSVCHQAPSVFPTCSLALFQDVHGAAQSRNFPVRCSSLATASSNMS